MKTTTAAHAAPGVGAAGQSTDQLVPSSLHVSGEPTAREPLERLRDPVDDGLLNYQENRYWLRVVPYATISWEF